jgi:hypothetical protein
MKISNLSQKLKELEQLEKEKREKWNELHNEYDKVRAKYESKVEDIFDFKNKYILIDDTSWGYQTYMYCETVMKGKDLSGNSRVLLRGYGFKWSVTAYEDETYCNWDEMIEFNIDMSEQANIQKQLAYIKELTVSEFNEAFYKMIGEISNRHEKNIKFYTKEDKN